MKKLRKFYNYIPVLIASTGSNFEAEIAGRIPEIKPIAAEIAVPMNIFQGESTNSKSPVKLDAIIETIKTKNSPINPPITERITASNKNWKRRLYRELD